MSVKKYHFERKEIAQLEKIGSGGAISSLKRRAAAEKCREFSISGNRIFSAAASFDNAVNDPADCDERREKDDQKSEHNNYVLHIFRIS